LAFGRPDSAWSASGTGGANDQRVEEMELRLQRPLDVLLLANAVLFAGEEQVLRGQGLAGGR